MGWQTDLFCNLTYNRKTFNSLSEVDDEIADLTETIEYHEGVLKELAFMTEPNKLLHLEEDEDLIYKIRGMVKESLEELEESYIERWKLEILRENWKCCHNEKGLAINPPECAVWPNAYIDGDFVKSVKHPNGYE